jgi:hypothetical protein
MTSRSTILWVGLAVVVVLVIALLMGVFEEPTPTPVTVDQEVVDPPPSEPETVPVQ